MFKSLSIYYVMDELDKDIIQCLSTGACSYQEIAKICKVTRNTIYRRTAALEKKGIIKAATSCIVNLDQLGIIPIVASAKVTQKNMDHLVYSLRNVGSIRILWRTYGGSDINLFAFCFPGQEGQSIEEIRTVLEESSCQNVLISIGFSWEKVELSPFESPTFHKLLVETLTQEKTSLK
jgi:DNA-binding Lrp family transcriptional regulator